MGLSLKFWKKKSSETPAATADSGNGADTVKETPKPAAKKAPAKKTTAAKKAPAKKKTGAKKAPAKK